jgi:hypothetical protein
MTGEEGHALFNEKEYGLGTGLQSSAVQDNTAAVFCVRNTDNAFVKDGLHYHRVPWIAGELALILHGLNDDEM